MSTEIINEEQLPRQRLSERVGAEVQRQTIEREQEAAFADPVDKFDPANPGGTMAKRITQRIQQERFAEQ